MGLVDKSTTFVPYFQLYFVLRTFFYTTLVLLCIACATVNSPKGGPVDSLPPRIIATNPQPYTVNFKGKKVTIEFNEYIQLKEQSKLFFVSPNPKRKPTLTIKGRAVVVEFRDSLDNNTTYRLDFGSAIVDNNEGNKLDGYSFVFSTGDVIDSLYMAGQVIDAHSQDTVAGAFIHFFDAAADSMTVDSVLFKSRANAVFRTDSNGFFVADILKEKPYRIYAFLDKNGDQAYQPGSDMVGFLDSTYNPIDMPAFSLQYDSTTRRSHIDPVPIRFELFTEKAIVRQNMQSHTRKGRNQLDLVFAAPQARYDSMQLTGVDLDWLIREQNETGDSITLWIAPPTQEQFKALPDSIFGSFVYFRQDSVMNFFPKREKLNFYSKTFVAKEKKRKETTEQTTTDSTKAKTEKIPFQFKVEAQQTLNPEHGIGFSFTYPLRQLDSTRITLTRIEDDPKSTSRSGRKRATTDEKAESPKIRTKEPFSFDSLSLRRQVLRANWKVGAQYELIIPDSVFVDITFAANDTLSSTFSIADPEKFGTIKLQTLTDPKDSTTYIVELMSGKAQELTPVQIRTGVLAGDVLTFRYLTPGFYAIRVIEDKNSNGKWDTGSLSERHHPERVRYFRTSNGRRSVEAKENWEINETVHLSELFDPPFAPKNNNPDA